MSIRTIGCDDHIVDTSITSRRYIDDISYLLVLFRVWQVCSPFYIKALAIGKGRFGDLRHKIAKDKGVPSNFMRVHNVTQCRNRPILHRTQFLIDYLTGFFKTFGQYVPTKDETHLPSTCTKTYVYGLYKNVANEQAFPADAIDGSLGYFARAGEAPYYNM